MSKKVLVLGATGAMGQYLAPMLAEMGYLVDGVSLDAAISTHKNLKYIQANTKAEGVLDSLDMVRLVTEIGMEFDVQIPAEELIPENFQNVNTIWALIERLDEE